MNFLALQAKDVINVNDGCKIGFVTDLEVDWVTGQIAAIVVERNYLFKILWFFKTPPVVTIPVDCIISVLGDVILVNIDVVEV